MASPNEIKINICDGAAIKRVLDDAVVGHLVNQLEFREDLTVSNWKLALSVVSCLLACLAQFYPAPFPANYYVLLVCCSLYFVCSGLLQAIALFYEQDFIFFGTTTSGPRPQAVHVRARLPRYESTYTLMVSAARSSVPSFTLPPFFLSSSPSAASQQQQQTAAAAAQAPSVTMARSVGAFFDSSGVFVEHRLRAELDRLLADFAQLHSAASKTD